LPALSDVTIKRAKLLVNGEWVEGNSTFQVLKKYSGEVIGEADVASEQQVERSR